MLEGTGPPKDARPLARPLHEQQLAGPVVRDQEARIHEFFRRCLQDARAAGRDRAWVYRHEIAAEGEAIGLNEAQCLKMAQIELERDWVVFTRRPLGQRSIGIVFTDHRGLRRLYGG